MWKFLVGVKLKEDGLGTMSRMKLWAATAGSGGEEKQPCAKQMQKKQDALRRKVLICDKANKKRSDNRS